MLSIERQYCVKTASFTYGNLCSPLWNTSRSTVLCCPYKHCRSRFHAQGDACGYCGRVRCYRGCIIVGALAKWGIELSRRSGPVHQLFSLPILLSFTHICTPRSSPRGGPQKKPSCWSFRWLHISSPSSPPNTPNNSLNRPRDATYVPSIPPLIP